MVLRTTDDDDQDLVRKFAKLQLLLGRAEEEAADIRDILLSCGVRVSDPIRRNGKRPLLRRFTDPRWEILARRGVGSLRIGPVVRRTVAVSIDGAKEFILTPALADLLAVLVEGEPDEDGLPAVRSYEVLAKAYSARTGRPAGIHAIVVGIERLREKLMSSGAGSPLLVETVARRGARFRLRLTSARSVS
jgi:hypothetical protein